MQDKDRNGFANQHFSVFIAKKEWSEYSLESKIRLLHLLRNSDSLIAGALENIVSDTIEKEQNEKEIDICKTFNFYYDE